MPNWMIKLVIFIVFLFIYAVVQGVTGDLVRLGVIPNGIKIRVTTSTEARKRLIASYDN